jgi:hypothetical protein
MSNSRKLRELNGGRLTRPRRTWTGKRRDTGATYVGRSSNADMRRSTRLRAEEAAKS